MRVGQDRFVRRWATARAVLGVVAAATVLVVSGCAADNGSDALPAVTNVQETGRDLATKFLTILQSGDSGALDAFLDATFQIQRADGSGATKVEYLANPAKVQTFELGKDLSAEWSGSVLTVRYSILVSETINGETFSKGEAPRLSTFVWHDGAWFLASHANFNLPAAGQAPVLDDPNATGRELAAEFIAILSRKDAAALAAFLAPAFQIQRADGTSADKSEYLAADISISSSEMGDDVEAIQDGNVLTVRWSLKLIETIEGSPTSEVFAPRLSTFVWQDGAWRLLAHANFNPPLK